MFKINYKEKIKRIVLPKMDIYFSASLIAIYLFFITGILTGSMFPDGLEGVVMRQYKTAEIIGVYEESGGINLLPILLNNIICAMAIIISGIMPYIFIPIIAAMFNAYIIGCAYGYCSLQLPIVQILMQYAPHLLVEFLAMTFASSVGLWLCGEAINRERKSQLSISTMCSLKMTTPIFVYIILPLLIIASILESCGI